MAQANLAAIRQVNTELAKMAMDVGRTNDGLRQATMVAAREYYNLGDAAEKNAARAVLSAKQIEEAWRKAMAKPAEEAPKGFGKIAEAAHGAMKGIGGTFGKLGRMFLHGGIWGAMAAAATKAFMLIWDHFAKESERAAKRAERAFNESITSIKNGAEAIDKAFDSAMSGMDKAVSRFDAMQNSVKELTKAEIELAKQHAIANGMDAASANAAAADLSAQVDFEAEERRLQNLIAMEQKRVDAAKDAEVKTAEAVKRATEVKTAAEADYQKKRDEYIEKHAIKEGDNLVVGDVGYVGATAENARQSREAYGKKFDESDEAAKMRENIRKAQDALKGIKTDEKALAAADEARAKIEQAQTALETLGMKREARELAVQNELAAKAEAEIKEREEKEKAAAEKRAEAEAKAAEKAAEKRAEAEAKAAEKAAAERARLDAQEAARRERERQAELAARIRDHQKLLDAERAEESKSRFAVSAAESKLQRAWGWYRNKESMAAQLREEKADAEARKQFEKDFDRLKGRRRDWRTAENLSVDDEAVRRVALAREEKEQAEKHLAEIEKNTANLAEKLDELLQIKG